MTIHSMSTEPPIVVPLANTHNYFVLPSSSGKPVAISSGTITGTWKIQVYSGPDGTTSPSTGSSWADTGVELNATNQMKRFTGLIGALYRISGGTVAAGHVSIRYMTAE